MLLASTACWASHITCMAWPHVHVHVPPMRSFTSAAPPRPHPVLPVPPCRRSSGPRRRAVTMMPVSTPKVLYRAPGQRQYEWVDLWESYVSGGWGGHAPGQLQGHSSRGAATAGAPAAATTATAAAGLPQGTAAAGRGAAVVGAAAAGQCSWLQAGCRPLLLFTSAWQGSN